MEKLSHHLTEIGKIVDQWESQLTNLKECRDAKADVFALDRIIQIFNGHVDALKKVYATRSAVLEKKTSEMSVKLQEFEKYFHVSKVETKKPEPTPSAESVSFVLQEYKTKEEIPILQYGIVNGLILYRFTATDYVSCTNVMIMDSNMGDNFRSICCTNGAKCSFGKDCKYFHDPLLWPGSNHVQRFPKSNLVKQCAFFGHMNMFADQIKTLDFDKLRTLARYVAIMGLLIHRTCAT